MRRVRCAREPVQAMSEMDASWPTTSPGARVASTPDRVPVHDALSPGTRLDEFEIVRVLGTGGFGIVYLARDHVLLRDVAIKEYMPAALAGRGEGVTVSLRSQGFADTFAKGLESFLSEARLLASFDHRSLVKVHRFWRSNATAYMAMQYYAGQTLKDARLHMTSPPDEAWLDAFIQALLGVLELLHGQGVYHRDISPDNILLLDDGRPVLLDFGSARRVMADSPQSFTAHLKPQFAPLEQYADESGGMRQGPWTDLYALGATLYFVLTGRAPTPSVVRAVRDVLPTLASQAGTTIPSVRAQLARDHRLDTGAGAGAATAERALGAARAERRDGAAAAVAATARCAGRRGAGCRAAVPDAAARAVRAGDARPVRPWFSRLAATFWGPAADPDSTPSRSRRRAHLSAAALLALTGMVALGWGAWTLDRPSLPPSGDPVSTPEAAMATTTKVVATSADAPMPALAPTTPSAMAPVALWVKPEAQQASGAEPGVSRRGRRRPPRSDRPPPRRKRRGPCRAIAIGRRVRHPKVQTSSAAAKSPARAGRRTHATAPACSRGPGAR